MKIAELDTPVAICHLDRFRQNVQRLQNYLDEHGIDNRPHIKTHKIPQFARWQMEAGAVGITCQKLGEVEVMAQGKIENIFLPYNLLGRSKLDRLVSLSRSIEISVTTDSEVVAEGVSSAVERAGETLTVLVEFDTGIGRCGVQSPREAFDLAQRIESLPGIEFGGLMTYPLNEHTDLFVRETRGLLEPAGIPVKRVSAGGTHCMWEAHLHPEVTEYRAGMYVYGDRYTVQSGAVTLDQCSLNVLSTVVSRPTGDRGILDAGSKSLFSDLLGLEGYGLILEYPEAEIYKLSEEHGHVDFSRCESGPAIGERVTLIPNHCCVVNNLFNEIVGVAGEDVVERFPVAARGLVT